ncbi:hypothetical protein JOM56_014115 [Amanita muscaria]
MSSNFLSLLLTRTPPNDIETGQEEMSIDTVAEPEVSQGSTQAPTGYTFGFRSVIPAPLYNAYARRKRVITEMTESVQEEITFVSQTQVPSSLQQSDAVQSSLQQSDARPMSSKVRIVEKRPMQTKAELQKYQKQLEYTGMLKTREHQLASGRESLVATERRVIDLEERMKKDMLLLVDTNERAKKAEEESQHWMEERARVIDLEERMKKDMLLLADANERAKKAEEESQHWMEERARDNQFLTAARERAEQAREAAQQRAAELEECRRVDKQLLAEANERTEKAKEEAQNRISELEACAKTDRQSLVQANERLVNAQEEVRHCTAEFQELEKTGRRLLAGAEERVASVTVAAGLPPLFSFIYLYFSLLLYLWTTTFPFGPYSLEAQPPPIIPIAIDRIYFLLSLSPLDYFPFSLGPLDS